MKKTALEYLEHGFSVIPVSQDKKPLIPWKAYQDRKPTKEEIQQWFQNPATNIGIVTGKISNLFCIDCDTDEAYEKVQEHISETLVFPIVNTPRGGKHLYFQFSEEQLTIAAGIIPGLDYRGQGGFVVAPPSQNGNGKQYSWLIDLQNKIPKIPESLFSFLNSCTSVYGFNPTLIPTQFIRRNIAKSMPRNIALVEGQRDQSLFHIANCLVKGGMHKDDIRYMLEIIAQSCDPPFPEIQLDAKIRSALQRAESRERNISEEVSEFVRTTSGYFTTTECHKELHLTTKHEKKAALMALLRMVDTVIEKHGNKNGCYRRIENEDESLEFVEGGIIEYPFKMPFGIHDLCKLYRKNIIVVAGSKSAGKTAFLLDIAFRNQDIKPVTYITSEMAHEEWTERITQLGKSKKDIRFKTLIKSGNFHDKVTGDDNIFLIDFLEIHENFWEIAKYIRMIHDKLKDGIALIAVQKKRGVELARGQDFSMEKARLYLSLDYIEYMGGCTKVTIVDAKAPKYGRSVRGAYKRVKISAQRMESLDDDWLIA